jgi:hypothetical protein
MRNRPENAGDAAAIEAVTCHESFTGAKLRTQMLLSDAAGLANGFAVGSIGGVLAAAAALLINARAIRGLLRQQ